MSVQHRPSLPSENDRKMQRSLGRRAALTSKDCQRLVKLQNLTDRKVSLVRSGRGDRQPQGFTMKNCAKVAAGSQHPSADVKFPPNLCHRGGSRFEGLTPRVRCPSLARVPTLPVHQESSQLLV